MGNRYLFHIQAFLTWFPVHVARFAYGASPLLGSATLFWIVGVLVSVMLGIVLLLVFSRLCHVIEVNYIGMLDEDSKPTLSPENPLGSRHANGS